MKVSTGPDIRYGATLTNGKSISGSRRKVLSDAILAWQRGELVVSWKVPGAVATVITQRTAKMEEDYNNSIAELQQGG